MKKNSFFFILILYIFCSCNGNSSQNTNKKTAPITEDSKHIDTAKGLKSQEQKGDVQNQVTIPDSTEGNKLTEDLIKNKTFYYVDEDKDGKEIVEDMCDYGLTGIRITNDSFYSFGMDVWSFKIDSIVLKQNSLILYENTKIYRDKEYIDTSYGYKISPVSERKGYINCIFPQVEKVFLLVDSVYAKDLIVKGKEWTKEDFGEGF
ncbi:hypothetical protein K5X82_08870 [Halosquirtibacter xylanolyticus]|uniref:hypothetical protein n=1 Tax=Halosquirtibacter xylanolyticus TaxID=3374599 RepID=UPI003748D5D5|nr:hypothetical protein K5X82_08870 [Prolixibacteraceae bacterium]